MLDLGAEQRRHQWLGGRIGRVVHDEALRPKGALEPAAERVGDALARAVVRRECVDELRRELRGRQRLAQVGHGTRDVVRVPEPPDRFVARTVGRRRRHLTERVVTGKDVATGDLGPVVVLGVDPEDRDHRHALLPADARGQPEGGDGLEQCVKRAAEQAGLLTGHDSHGGRIGQALGGGSCSVRCIAPCLLGGDDRGQFGTRPRVRALRRHLGRPRLRLRRIAGEERGDLRVVERVVERQRPHPGEASNIHGQPERAVRGRGGRRLHGSRTVAPAERCCQGSDIRPARERQSVLRSFDRQVPLRSTTAEH